MRMRKGLRRGQYDMNAENFDNLLGNTSKRRGFSGLFLIDTDSKRFFDRVVNVKKIRDFVFVTKASSKNR